MKRKVLLAGSILLALSQCSLVYAHSPSELTNMVCVTKEYDREVGSRPGFRLADYVALGAGSDERSNAVYTKTERSFALPQNKKNDLFG